MGTNSVPTIEVKCVIFRAIALESNEENDVGGARRYLHSLLAHCRGECSFGLGNEVLHLHGGEHRFVVLADARLHLLAGCGHGGTAGKAVEERPAQLRRDGIGEALVAEKLVGLVGHGADASGDGEGGEEIQCGSAPTTLPDIPESGRGMRLPQAEP